MLASGIPDGNSHRSSDSSPGGSRREVSRYRSIMQVQEQGQHLGQGTLALVLGVMVLTVLTRCEVTIHGSATVRQGGIMTEFNESSTPQLHGRRRQGHKGGQNVGKDVGCLTRWATSKCCLPNVPPLGPFPFGPKPHEPIDNR